MRIGVNCRELLSHRMEGICRYINETTKRLVLSHPEDEFVFFFDRPYDEQFIYADNVTPVVLAPQARHPILWYLWFEHSLPAALKKHKVDVLYSGDTYLSLKSDVKTLLVCHDLAYLHYPDHIRWSHRQYYRHYFPKFHDRADHIVAVSGYTKSDVVEKYKLPADKITVGYNATPPGFRGLTYAEKQEQREVHADGCPYFIFVGSLHPRKNLVRLILAFDQFKKDSQTEHKLVLIGRFAWKNEELQSALKRISCADDIVMKGSIMQGIQPIVGGSDGLFYVSLFEGFGIPIVEGYSARVPVVTSTVSSMPEVAGDCAILVDPTDTDAISRAMQQLAHDPPDEAALDRAEARAKSFTWQQTADHIYQQLTLLHEQ